eukprot:378576-Pelagomonas_calceolata.AAC.5
MDACMLAQSKVPNFHHESSLIYESSLNLPISCESAGAHAHIHACTHILKGNCRTLTDAPALCQHAAQDFLGCEQPQDTVQQPMPANGGWQENCSCNPRTGTTRPLPLLLPELQPDQQVSSRSASTAIIRRLALIPACIFSGVRTSSASSVKHAGVQGD